MLFEEIKQERRATLLNSVITKKKKRNIDPLLLADNSSKIVTLKETIEGLRKEVGEVEKDIYK